MAMAFIPFPHWLWGGKDHENPNSAPALASDFPSGLRDLDSVKLPSIKRPKMRSSSRRIKRKWQSREEWRIDRKYDIVLVPSDGECMSGSESDDSDWSIGWLEPHAPEFQIECEAENSFAVLVPCYGRGRCEQAESSKNRALGAGDFANEYLSDEEDPHFFWLYWTHLELSHHLCCRDGWRYLFSRHQVHYWLLIAQELHRTVAFISSELVNVINFFQLGLKDAFISIQLKLLLHQI